MLTLSILVGVVLAGAPEVHEGGEAVKVSIRCEPNSEEESAPHPVKAEVKAEGQEGLELLDEDGDPATVVLLGGAGEGTIQVRWTQGVLDPGAEVRVVATAKDATCTCDPVTLDPVPSEPRLGMAIAQQGVLAVGQWVFEGLSIEDEDGLLRSATVTLHSEAAASMVTQWSHVVGVDRTLGGAQTSAEERDGGQTYVLTLTASQDDGHLRVEDVEDVLMTLRTRDGLMALQGQSVRLSLRIQDADGLEQETTLVVAVQGGALLPDAAVRLRLIEYARDGQYNAYFLAQLQGERVIVRDPRRLANVQAQVLLNQTLLNSVKVERVDLLVTQPGGQPQWSLAEDVVSAVPHPMCGGARRWKVGPTARLIAPEQVAERVRSSGSSAVEARDVYVRVVMEGGSTQVFGPRPVEALYLADAPLYELSLSSRPASWGLTHVYCQDVIDAGDAGDYCEANPFEQYWSTSFNAAPLSLRARVVPSAVFPVFGFSFDMALGVLSSAGTVLSSNGLSEQTGSPDQNANLSAFQASIGPDLRLTINKRDVDVMFYVGSIYRDVGDLSRMRMTMGVALVTPFLSASANDLQNLVPPDDVVVPPEDVTAEGGE